MEVITDPIVWLSEQKARYHNKKVSVLETGSLSAFQKALEQGCLFHGTPMHKPVNELVPHTTRLHSKRVVFAGPPWVALCFTARWTDSDVEMYVQDGVPYFHIRSRSVFDAFKKGGIVYQLSPESFEHPPPPTRLARYEFISEKAVRPITHVFCPDPLGLIEDMGVSVSVLQVSKPHIRETPLYQRW